MSEILFRGKLIDSSEWMYGYVEVIGNIHDNPELLAQPADPDAQEL